MKQRFKQPSCAVSLPALIVTDDPGDDALAFPDTGSATHLTYSSRRNSDKHSPQATESRRKSHEEKTSFDSAKAACGKGRIDKSIDIKKTVKVVKSKILVGPAIL